MEADRPEDVQGGCVYGLVTAEYRDAFRRFNERVCRGEPGTLEFEIEGLRGTRRHLEAHAAPLRGPDGRKVPPGPEQRFTPSGLPDDWPLAWGPGVYAFPEVYPQVPMRKDCPPEQLNLEKVLDYVTDL